MLRVFVFALAAATAATEPVYPVPLGTAANFVVLAKTAITTIAPSMIVGDIGVSPIFATAITGFTLTADSSNTFSTSTQVTGKVFAFDYSPPTPVYMATAVLDMETAYKNASARSSDDSKKSIGAGTVGGVTFTPGVYWWDTGVSITNDIYIKGTDTDLFIFQIAKTLSVPANVKMILQADTAGGTAPLASNIVWQVAGAVTAGAGAHLEGVFLLKTAITIGAGSSLNGRILAQTAATIQKANINVPPSSDEKSSGEGTSSLREKQGNTLDDDSSQKDTMITVGVIVGVVGIFAIGAAAFFYAKYRRATTQPMKSVAVADVALTEAK
jgi:hypothetical protein